MIPDVVWGVLAGIPLTLAGLFFNSRRDRTQAVLTQQQIDGGRIKDLFEEGRSQNARIDAANAKIFSLQQSQLECESEKNEALAKNVRCEEERQRVTTLLLQQQKELERLRKHRNDAETHRDQTG